MTHYMMIGEYGSDELSVYEFSSEERLTQVFLDLWIDYPEGPLDLTIGHGLEERDDIIWQICHTIDEQYMCPECGE